MLPIETISICGVEVPQFNFNSIYLFPEIITEMGLVSRKFNPDNL
jgi:hypothetical protein